MQVHYNRDSVKRNSRNSVPIYSAGSGIVGVVENGVFRKSILGSKHLLRKPLAISISEDAIEDAKKKGANEIQVTDKETGAVYCSSIPRFLERGFMLDRGFGKQIALPLGEWKKPGEVAQPGLWGSM